MIAASECPGLLSDANGSWDKCVGRICTGLVSSVLSRDRASPYKGGHYDEKRTQDAEMFRFMVWVVMAMIGATGPAEALEPKYGGVLRIGVMVESVDLDPHILRAASSALITVNICEGLTSHGPNYKVVPTLATSWDVSKDRKTYTFNRRLHMPKSCAILFCVIPKWCRICENSCLSILQLPILSNVV